MKKLVILAVLAALGLTGCGSSDADSVVPVEPVPHCSEYTEYDHRVTGSGSDVYTITHNQCNDVTWIQTYSNTLEYVSNTSEDGVGEIARYNYSGEVWDDALSVYSKSTSSAQLISITYHFEKDGTTLGWYIDDEHGLVEFDYTKAPYNEYYATMQELFTDGITVMQEHVQLYN